MQILQERAIRERTAALVMEWADDRQPPFTGETAEGFVEAITVAHLIADEARLNLHRWIDAARRTGLSWADIGCAFGISKQAAQQRFGMISAGEQPSASDGLEIVRTRYSAIGEASILRAEGQKKNELIRTDSNSLVFCSTTKTWEYRRRLNLGSVRKEMQDSGWTFASAWPPLAYFKRPVPVE